MSSSCSSSGIAWAISGPGRTALGRSERPRDASRPRKPRRALEQRCDGGREGARGDDVELDRNGRAAAAQAVLVIHGRSPAAGLADEPVEDARGDEPAVLGGRADVVDRVRARRPGSRRRGRRSPASAGGPRGPPRCRGTDRRGRHRPEREPDVASRRECRARPSRQPSATTTLLIDWARRVPTFRKRSSRPASSGTRMRSSSSSGARAVRR